VNASAAAAVFERLRGSLNVGAVHAGARRPFKFFLCGDPALLGSLRGVLLSGMPGDSIPPDAAAAFETLDLEIAHAVAPGAHLVVYAGDAGGGVERARAC